MQHQSLTAQIASKGKKSIETFQPTFFSEIPYSNVAQINYLRDLEEKKKNIDFPIFQFEKDFGQQAPVNQFDMLANTLYKKIMQNGYIQQKKAPSKKKKKTKNPFDYDYEDAWINDQEAITIKKNIYAKFENFKSLNQGVDQFYDSEIYKSSIAQIQQMSKKRTNEISMDAQQLEEIKKKIKQNISIAHSKIKQQIDTQKPTNVGLHIEQIQMNVKNENENQLQVKVESQNYQDKSKIDKDQEIFKQKIHEVTQNNLQNALKSDQTKNSQKIQCQQEDLTKKSKKSVPKVKSTIPKKKKQKVPPITQIIEKAPQDTEYKMQSEVEKKKSVECAQCLIQERINEAFDNQGKVESMNHKQQFDKNQGQKITNQNQRQNMQKSNQA